MRLGRAFAIVVLAAGLAEAAPRTIRGVVVHDARPIAGASVLSERGAIATTDVDGYFTIEVTDGDRDLTIVATGYITRTLRIGEEMRVELEAASGAEVIEVSGKAPEETKPLRYTLTVDEIRSIPGAGNDILRAAQVLPGVARIPFSFGGLVLRGTSPRDTAIYMDGIEVPIGFHFGGVTSFYPSGMLDDLSLANGGFDASYGRAQGGLVTLTTREPRTDRWRMGGSIGLFDSSIQAEGPWKQGGVIVGLRRSYFDRIVAPFVEDDVPLPSYYDFQIRTSWGDPRKRGRINPMIFGSIDRVASSEAAVTSMFIRAAVPYLRQWGPTSLRIVPWIGTNRLAFSDEADDEGDNEEFSRPVYLGGVRTELVRDFKWGHLKAGAELSSGYLDQLSITLDDDNELGGNSTISWSDLGGWVEGRFKLDGERIAIKPGLRVELYGLSREVVVDPRLNIHEKLTSWLTLRQAIGRYHQPPIPGDVDPEAGNPALDSSYNDQFSLGVDTELPDGWLVSATGFYNDGRDNGVEVRDPSPGSELPEPNLGGLGPTFELLLEKQLGFAQYRENLGRARSYGLELGIKRRVGPWFSLLSYTLSKSERTDDPRNPVNPLHSWRPFELDQRHNLQIAVSRQYPKWKLGGRLQIVSGNPYTPRDVGLVDGPAAWSGRLPTFWSIDLRADRRWKKCWGELVFYIDVQNVTNHRNVEGREYDDSDERDEDILGLPIIPFLGLEFLPTI
jgi:outer membrane receptor protein involved in Fe transport